MIFLHTHSLCYIKKILYTTHDFWAPDRQKSHPTPRPPDLWPPEIPDNPTIAEDQNPWPPLAHRDPSKRPQMERLVWSGKTTEKLRHQPPTICYQIAPDRLTSDRPTSEHLTAIGTQRSKQAPQMERLAWSGKTTEKLRHQPPTICYNSGIR